MDRRSPRLSDSPSRAGGSASRLSKKGAHRRRYLGAAHAAGDWQHGHPVPDRAFTLYVDGGTINWVQIDIAEAAEADHLISPEERVRIAMARQ